MTKYEIVKLIDEIRGAFPNGLTEKDIADLLKYSDCSNFEWLESFDDEQAARAYFEKTYRYVASTSRRQGLHGQYLYVEYYQLHRMEYDEDGACAEGNPIASIYEPLPTEDED